MPPTRLRIPYPTIVGLEQVLALLRVAKPPVRVDRAYLLGQGFAPNAVAPLLEAVAFLGLIDAHGALLPLAKSFTGDQGAAIAAFRPVARHLRPPYPDRKSLAAALAARSDRNDTSLPQQATFVDWLAQRAGVTLIERRSAKPGARAGVQRARRPASLLRARVRAAEAEAGVGDKPVPFHLVVDRKTTPADLDRMLGDIRQAMSRLSQPAPKRTSEAQ